MRFHVDRSCDVVYSHCMHDIIFVTEMNIFLFAKFYGIFFNQNLIRDIFTPFLIVREYFNPFLFMLKRKIFFN